MTEKATFQPNKNIFFKSKMAKKTIFLHKPDKNKLVEEEGLFKRKILSYHTPLYRNVCGQEGLVTVIYPYPNQWKSAKSLPICPPQLQVGCLEERPPLLLP